MMNMRQLALAATSCIVLAIAARTAHAAVVASDNAADPAYADGWTSEEGNADNGGTGFGAWTGSSYGAVPTMEIDTTPLPDNDLGAPAFRLGTGGVMGGYFVERPFASPMQVGQSFTMDYDAYTISPEGQPGRDILIGFNSAGGERLSFYAYYYNDGTFIFGTDFWGVNSVTASNNLAGGASLPGDPLSGIDWQTPYTTTDSSDGFSMTLDIVTIDTYRLRIVDDNVTKIDVSGQFYGGAAAGQAINKLVLYGSETSFGTPDPGGVAYFNNLEISTADTGGVAGDFNGDNKVDASDYTVWRDHLGAADESSINDNGNGTGGVDAGDYGVWKMHFGEMPGSGGLAGASSVPEPASWFVMLTGALATMPFGNTLNRRRR